MDRKKLVHIHSNVLDKQPTPQALELGELAVNYAAYNSDASGSSGSFIATKNSSGDVVRFSEDGLVVDWMEYKEVLPYSASVVSPTTQDLENNRSQLVVKLNQEVASKTPGSAEVSGKIDIHGHQIGSGFGIDMSLYAMNGANPSFSSVTATNGASISGESFTVDTNEIEFNSPTMRLKGETMVVAATDNNLGLTAKNDILESAEGDVVISADNDICETCGNDATFYGASKTNIGVDCSGTSISDATAIHGKDVSIEGETLSLASDGNVQIEGNSVDINSVNEINVVSDNGSATISAKTYSLLYGKDATVVGENDNNAKSNITVIRGNEVTIESADNGRVIMHDGNDGKVIVSHGSVDIGGESVDICGIDSTTIGFVDSTQSGLTTTVQGNEVVINSSDNLGLTANSNAVMYGKESTVIGSDDDEITSEITRIDGGEILISAYSGDVIINSDGAIIQSPDYARIYTESAVIQGSKETIIGKEEDELVSGSTTIVKGAKVGISSNSEISIAAESDANIIANNNAVMYGKESTVIGSDDDEIISEITRIDGGEVFISAYSGDVIINSDGAIIQSPDYARIYTESAVIQGSKETIIGKDEEDFVSGCTTIVKGAKVGISSNSEISIAAESDANIIANNDIANTCGNNISVFGANNTNIGVGFDSNTVSVSTNINGQMININGSLVDCSTSLFDLTGNEHISSNLTVDGNIYGTVVSPSDERLKNSIKPIDEEKLENAHNIELKQFVFNNENKTNYGAIAQDVQNSNLEELVSEDSNGFLGINYTSLLTLKVAYLEKEVDRLNKKLNEVLEKIG